MMLVLGRRCELNFTFIFCEFIFFSLEQRCLDKRRKNVNLREEIEMFMRVMILSFCCVIF